MAERKKTPKRPAASTADAVERMSQQLHDLAEAIRAGDGKPEKHTAKATSLHAAELSRKRRAANQESEFDATR
jgi:hypothetical protein